MAKIYKIQMVPLFLAQWVKKSSGKGELLGYDMFQAEQDMVIFTSI